MRTTTTTTTTALVIALMMMVVMVLPSTAMEVYPQTAYSETTVFAIAEESYPMWDWGDEFFPCRDSQYALHTYTHSGIFTITANGKDPATVEVTSTGVSVLNWEMPTSIVASSSEEGYPAANAEDLSQISFWLADSEDTNPTLTVSAPDGENIVALKAMFVGNGTPPLTEMSLTLTTDAGTNDCDFTIPEGNGPLEWNKDWISLKLENPGQTVAIEFLEETPPSCVEIRVATV